MIDEANAVVVVLVVGALAFLVSLIAVPTVRRVALRTGILDRPGGAKLHAGATPYLGGLAIGLAALLIPSLFQDWTRQAAYIGIAAIMVAVCGLVDDLRNLNPYVRLGVEIMAAGLAVHAGARIDLFDSWLDVVVTIVWLVVITNSFNLLDNMDGVAGTIATATAIALVVAAVLQEQILVGALAAAVAGGCVGFLIYNWHPASIFMGDAGSLLLGFLLAVISLKLRWSTGYGSSITAVILIMFPAVFDTTLVVISRTRAGRTIMVGGTDHTSHRLNQLGLSVRWVAFSLGLVAVACASLGVMVGRGVVHPLFALLPLILVASVVFVPLLRLPVYPAMPPGSARLSQPTSAVELVDQLAVQVFVVLHESSLPEQPFGPSLRPTRPIAARSRRSRASLSTAAASRSASSTGTTSPVTPSATTCRTAPTSVATAGTPCMAASIRPPACPRCHW